MIRSPLLIAALLFNATSHAQELEPEQGPEPAQTLGEALERSSFDINFRLRYEQVEDAGFAEDAAATTLRSRATWSSAPLAGWQLLGEVDNVTAVGAEQFNSTANGETEYPVVADPNGSEINRAQLAYINGGAQLTFGRQRINHGNQRFIGGVGWRQNEQTFDAARAQWKLSEKISVDYGYSWNVNRIFGPDGDNADLEGDVHALRLDYTPASGQQLALFHYSLDFDEAAALSNATSGIHYTGSGGPLTWQLAAARQRDTGGNTADYSASYFAAELGNRPLFGAHKLAFAAGGEWLGADGEGRFITPLATLHKFQGFADKFLNTPADGLRDYYLRGSISLAGIALADAQLTVSYHQYSADRGGADYGDELNFVTSYAFSENISALAKYARYSADQWSDDTDKFWLAVEIKL